MKRCKHESRAPARTSRNCEEFFSVSVNRRREASIIKSRISHHRAGNRRPRVSARPKRDPRSRQLLFVRNFISSQPQLPLREHLRFSSVFLRIVPVLFWIWILILIFHSNAYLRQTVATKFRGNKPLTRRRCFERKARIGFRQWTRYFRARLKVAELNWRALIFRCRFYRRKRLFRPAQSLN